MQTLWDGPGAYAALAEYIQNASRSKRILFLTSRSLEAHPLTLKLHALLKESPRYQRLSFSTSLLSASDIRDVQTLVQLEGTPDLILALGGGSIIDLAKCLKFSLTQSPGVPIIEVIAIPTTAGTGSEATPFATVFINRIKTSTERADLLPEKAVLLPEFLLSVPAGIARCCALDTIAQSTESLWSNRADAESQAQAEESLVLALASWKDAVLKQDLPALQNLQKASYLSGLAIAKTRTTLAHALSYRYTSEFGVPHGLAVFLNLEAVARFNVSENPLQWSIGVQKIMKAYHASTKEELALKIRSILIACEFSPNFSAHGLPTSEKLLPYVESAIANPRASNNPRTPNATDVLTELLRSGGSA